MPRCTPQIEITYDIDANGILNVEAVEKSSGKTQKITITNDKNRMSAEDIEKLVKEAELYKEQDDEMREKIDAKNQLETYVYSVKSSILEEKISTILSDDDKKTINSSVEDAISWLNNNTNVEKDIYLSKKKEIEDIIMPIMSKIGGGGGGGGVGGGGVPDFSNMAAGMAGGMPEGFDPSQFKKTNDIPTNNPSTVKIEEVD